MTQIQTFSGCQETEEHMGAERTGEIFSKALDKHMFLC